MELLRYIARIAALLAVSVAVLNRSVSCRSMLVAEADPVSALGRISAAMRQPHPAFLRRRRDVVDTPTIKILLTHIPITPRLAQRSSNVIRTNSSFASLNLAGACDKLE